MESKTKQSNKNANSNFRTKSLLKKKRELLKPQNDPICDIRKTLRKISLEKVFEANEMSIKQTTKNNGEVFKDNLEEHLLKELRTLEEQRHEVLVLKPYLEAKIFGTRLPFLENEEFNGLVRRRKKIKLNQREEPKQTSDSYVSCKIENFQLKEHEILEDLIAIKNCSIDLNY